MGKIKVIKLTDEKRNALENGYRKGESHIFRRPCQMILLKSERRSSVEVADILGCCEVLVNNWLSCFEEEAIERLKTQFGRGATSNFDFTESETFEKGQSGDSEAFEFGQNVIANFEQSRDILAKRQIRIAPTKRFLFIQPTQEKDQRNRQQCRKEIPSSFQKNVTLI